MLTGYGTLRIKELAIRQVSHPAPPLVLGRTHLKSRLLPPCLKQSDGIACGFAPLAVLLRPCRARIVCLQSSAIGFDYSCTSDCT